MDYTIEKAKPEDAAALIEYLKVIGGETDNLTFGAEGFPITVEEERKYLEGVDADGKSVMLSVWEDGKIIANAHLQALPRRLSHRVDLGVTVLREAWGRGIGTALMERLIAHAREHGIEIIELQVRCDNTRAIRLYEKFGFVSIGRYPGFMKVDGELIDCQLMNLYL